MNKAKFIFTKYANSFSVHIQNLEELSVEQIKTIESFVKQRNGIFDFDKYTFSIQKKIEFNEFVSLIKYVGIDASFKEQIIYKTTKAKVEFGKYKGMQYSELPDSYLLWLKGNYRGKDREIIDNELKSRTI